MKIPVFVSSPTALSPLQEDARKMILKLLNELGLEPRALGRTDYPSDFPLKEVLIIAKHCAGGVILGFEQFQTENGIWKRGSKFEKVDSASEIKFPTQWNNIETGILFALDKPLLVFKEQGINGGVFDNGVTDVFIQNLPIGKVTKENKNAIKESMLNWQRKVRSNYYGD